MAESRFICAHCGAQLSDDAHPLAVYCGNKCYRAAQAKRRQLAQPLATCIVCFTEFRPKAADRRKCCGRECGTAFNGMQATLNKTGGRVAVSTLRKKCVRCGSRHSRRGALCSDSCKAPAYVPVVSSTCASCGKEYDRRNAGASRYLCSVECKLKAKAKAKRAGRAKRKALERGAKTADVIDPVAVFMRDGWRCQLCGKRTPQRLRGTFVHNAPELDHILPISLGGKHEWANVQCACRACNHGKGARPMGQLMLFPVAA